MSLLRGENYTEARIMQITLLDGKQLNLPGGSTAQDVARYISERLAGDAVAAQVDGQLTDLMTPLPDNSRLNIMTKKNLDDAAPVFRHSLGHVMSQAVGEFYAAKGYGPHDIKRGVGPAIENGWYQDFDLPEPISEEDFPEIERIMQDILGRKEAFSRREVSRTEALDLFALSLIHI